MAHALHSIRVVRDANAAATHFRKCRRIPRLAYRRARSQRAFTLVELAVVVVIVGILAMLAVVAYRKLMGSARTAEATAMIQSIRVAQEAYHAETQQYANISTTLDSTYPQATPYRVKTAWGGACTTCLGTPNPLWSDLPVHVDGPVEFGYATVAGAAGNAPAPQSVTVNGATVTFPAKSPTDFFLVEAKGDTDGNGVFCRIYGTSWSTDLMVDQDGE